MKEALFPRRDVLRRGGFTLVEVVIALAIFLFGALAIVRIFPPALGIIQNSGDQLIAINLNRSTLAKFEQSPGLVPDAIYDTTPNFSGAVVGTSLRNASLPRTNVQDFADSALGHFKTISRETHTVVGTTATPYVVAQYPYDTPVVVCEEDEVEGVTMRDDPAGTTTDFTLDFTDARLKSTGTGFRDTSTPFLPPSTHRNPNTNGALVNVGDTVFYVSYSWLENSAGGSNVQSTIDEPLTYQNTTPTKTVQGNRTVATPIAGPVQVRFRRLKYVAPVPNVGSPTANDHFRGIVNLDNTFALGEKVSLDYTRQDWRWLVNDESPSVKAEAAVATENYRLVNLPVRLLDNNEAIYTLLADQTGTLLKGNYQGGVANGQGFPPASFGNPDTTPVNFKTGQITFDLAFATSVRSRVAYRTLDNWTRQLSVAARSYKPYYAGVMPQPIPAEPWRNYINDASMRQTLYFPPTEAGKSVAVSYTFTAGTVDFEVNGRVFQIDQGTIPSPSTINTNGLAIDNLVSHLQLTDNNGDLLVNSQIRGIQAVRGVSVQARTAWLDGNKFTQVSSVGVRKVDK